VYQINTSTKNVVGPIDCGGLYLEGIAIAPDGKKAYVNNTYNSCVSVIDLTQDPPGATGPIPIANSYELNFIAITPDPAPAADFSVTAGTAGSSTQFDASSSVSPVGTIVTYAWNFGDGTLITTSTPLTSHIYATAGTYNVELTVTNSAGTSVKQTFTGQTVSNAGSEENAHITKSVVISSPTPEPPPRFCGKVKKHHHRLRLKTKWTPSPSPNIVGYEVYKKHTLLRTTPSLCFKKTLHPKDYYKHHLHAYKHHLEKLYKVRAVNSGDYKSIFTPLDIRD
jgi:PKD repeat protein